MSKRMFIALDITLADKEIISLWREQNLSLPFKIIPQENFHITLAFLSLVSEEQQEYLVKLISEKHIDIHRKINNFTQGKNANLDAVHLTLSKLGYFNRAQVLHFMLANCPVWLSYLAKIITALCQKCKISLDKRAYKPHLSLYRKAKKPIIFSNSLLLNTQLPSSFHHRLTINSFSAYHSYSSSSGITYFPICTWKLNY